MKPQAQNPAQAEAPKFVAIARFRFMPDMLLAKGLLESAGIEAETKTQSAIGIGQTLLVHMNSP